MAEERSEYSIVGCFFAEGSIDEECWSDVDRLQEWGNSAQCRVSVVERDHQIWPVRLAVRKEVGNRRQSRRNIPCFQQSADLLLEFTSIGTDAAIGRLPTRSLIRIRDTMIAHYVDAVSRRSAESRFHEKAGPGLAMPLLDQGLSEWPRASQTNFTDQSVHFHLSSLSLTVSTTKEFEQKSLDTSSGSLHPFCQSPRIQPGTHPNGKPAQEFPVLPRQGCGVYETSRNRFPEVGCFGCLRVSLSEYSKKITRPNEQIS